MKGKRFLWIMLTIWAFLGLVNLLARLCTPLTDFYIAHIFPLISGLWSRISGLVPFSVGEWMIVCGIGLIIVGIIGLPLVLLFGKSRRRRILAIAGQCYGWVVTWVFYLLTFRFFVLYQGTQVSRTIDRTTYSNADVLRVYRTLAEQANAEGELVARDADGHFILTDDLIPEAKACMMRLANDYPQFQGFYPDPKPIHHAYFFSQQNLIGIYFPHSMEANYNPVVYAVNLPVTICHEYTHLKGNIFEDEAGYYAFLACQTSESADFRYSAYISALEWFDVDFGDDAAAWEEFQEIYQSMSEGVRTDLYSYVPDDYWETHRETEEVIPTAIVTETAEKVMDASLKVNGVPEGVGSYAGMTLLLLDDYLNLT